MFFYFFLEKLTPSFRKPFLSKQRDQTDIFLIRLKEFRDLRRPPIFPCNSLTKHFKAKQSFPVRGNHVLDVTLNNFTLVC